MAADVDVAAVKNWLLGEARGLQLQQEETRRRLEAVRGIMRLLAAYEDATRPTTKEASS
jgi:hypothetical protein